MKKSIVLFAFVVSLVLLAGCMPVQPEAPMAPAAPQAMTALTTPEEKIANALSAGPEFITADAAVMDRPAEAGGEMVELRPGTNGWTCLPDDPTNPVNDPVCADETWLAFYKAATSGAARRPTNWASPTCCKAARWPTTMILLPPSRPKARIGRSILRTSWSSDQAERTCRPFPMQCR